MNKRKNLESEITNKEPKEIENATKDQQKAAQVEKNQTEVRQTVTKMKVSLYGNLRVEVKDEEAIIVLGVDINIMSFWMKDNNKAEWLKFIFEKYVVNIVGLQEVCINWSD